MLKTQFIIGTNPLDIVDYGPNFYGRVVGNFMGSEYTFFDKVRTTWLRSRLSAAERRSNTASQRMCELSSCAKPERQELRAWALVPP
jgi:hypothetical protein